jgi:hypothetical protein
LILCVCGVPHESEVVLHVCLCRAVAIQAKNAQSSAWTVFFCVDAYLLPDLEIKKHQMICTYMYFLVSVC